MSLSLTTSLCLSGSLLALSDRSFKQRYRAWKNQLAPDGTKVRFIADDKAELTLALGMLFDATPLLGGPRSKVCFTIPHPPERTVDRFGRKRYVVVTEGDKITSVAVEAKPGEVTITAADKILPLL